MSQRTKDRYRIQDQIGDGGMATVYRAFDTVLQRAVALKVLGSQVEPQLKERFQAEAQAVAKLNHPNIINVYDVGEMDGSPYIVMEYVDGITLKELIQEWNNLPASEALGIVKQIGSALSYAHRKGIIHCDVKPHNILITPSGRAKLVDFGIAQAQVGRKRRKREQVYGTPLYMAPEQMAGRPVSPRTDVYGLGLVLWEALTGRPPERPDPNGPVWLDYAGAQLPREFVEVIREATAPDPGDRYPTIDEMMRPLVGWRPSDGSAAQQTSKNVVVRGPEPPEAARTVVNPVPAQPQPTPRRGLRRLLSLPIVALLLLLCGLGSTQLWGYYRDRTQGRDNPSAVGAAQLVKAPDLVGMTLQEARSTAETAGVRLQEERTRSDEDDVGKVLRQTTAPGTMVQRNSAIPVQVGVAGTASDSGVVLVPATGTAASEPGDADEPTPVETPRPDDKDDATARPAKTPTPRPTPVVARKAGERVVQLSALDEPVSLKLAVDGKVTERVLQPGAYYMARGRAMRIEATPPDKLLVTVNGKFLGTLDQAVTPTPTARVAAPAAPTRAATAVGTARATPSPGVRVAQLAATGTVRVRVNEDGRERRLTLRDGETLELRGRYLRIQANPARLLRVAINGEYRGTLLEAASRLVKRELKGPGVYISYGSRPDDGSNENADASRQSEDNNGNGQGENDETPVDAQGDEGQGE
jgi:serine/threonine-protein kinase